MDAYLDAQTDLPDLDEDGFNLDQYLKELVPNAAAHAGTPPKTKHAGTQPKTKKKEVEQAIPPKNARKERRLREEAAARAVPAPEGSVAQYETKLTIGQTEAVVLDWTQAVVITDHAEPAHHAQKTTWQEQRLPASSQAIQLEGALMASAFPSRDDNPEGEGMSDVPEIDMLLKHKAAREKNPNYEHQSLTCAMHAGPIHQYANR